MTKELYLNKLKLDYLYCISDPPRTLSSPPPLSIQSFPLNPKIRSLPPPPKRILRHLDLCRSQTDGWATHLSQFSSSKYDRQDFPICCYSSSALGSNSPVTGSTQLGSSSSTRPSPSLSSPSVHVHVWAWIFPCTSPIFI